MSIDHIELPAAPSRAALVLDADRTLATIDTGRAMGRVFHLNQSIRALFERHGYAPSAFARVSELWATVPAQPYQDACATVAREVALHPPWLELLRALPLDVPILVITAGIPQIWRLALANHGVQRARVFGGCHAGIDPYFVYPGSKALLVDALRQRGAWVVAAGDSVIDLPMLQSADLPLFVADSKGSPHLRERLAEIPGVWHFITDQRRFESCPPLDWRELLVRIDRERTPPDAP